MRAGIALIAASLILAAAQIPQPVLAAALRPSVAAGSAILIEGRTGTVLFERAADLRRPPASTTKVLTALLVVERLRPETMVTISPRASAQRSGAAIGLEPGELWRADVLMDALMLASANDAALALAEAVGGSVEGFAALMNQRARAAGATRSTFVVPHGLYHPEHLTTSRDLALIAREALRHPAFAAVARRQVFTWQRQGLPPRVIVNRNRLLWTFRGADGVKTGWIRQSGQCLVASATRDGRQLIAVVMDSADVFGDSARLLDYGFNNFRLTRAAARGEVVLRQAPDGAADPLEAVVAEDLFVVTPPIALRREVRLRADLRPPIHAGQRVGELLIYAGSAVVGRARVAAVSDIEAHSVWRQLEQWMRGLMNR